MASTNPDRSAVPDYLAKLRLDDRVFVVLGGGNGIGRQTCHALSQAGAIVACVDREPSLAEMVAEETGGIALVGDVNKRTDLDRVFAEASKAGPIRGVVGIVGMPVFGSLLDFDEEKWRSQFDLVFNHACLAIQIGGRALVSAGGGSMVFVGSMAGITKIPGQSAYGVAKAALHKLIGAAANELGPSGIRVNAVAPGFVRTPRLRSMVSAASWQAMDSMTALGHTAEPAEIAAAILFLSSDLASHVTGHVLLADGGITGTIAPPKLN